jgi:hypothetical protein
MIAKELRIHFIYSAPVIDVWDINPNLQYLLLATPSLVKNTFYIFQNLFGLFHNTLGHLARFMIER